MRPLLLVVLGVAILPAAEPVLPAGAVLRLGDPRLRHAGLRDFVLLADGKTAVTGGADRFLRSWDLATGNATRTVSLGDEPASMIALAPDGSLVACQHPGRLVLRDAVTGKEMRSWRTMSPASRLAFSADGSTLAGYVAAGQVTCWDCKTGRERHFGTPPRSTLLMDQPLHLSPDGKLLAVGGASAQTPLDVFDTTSGKNLYSLFVCPTAATISPDGKTLAVIATRAGEKSDEPALCRYDLATGKEQAVLPLGEGKPECFVLAFSPDGKRLACTAGAANCIRDAATGRILQRLPDNVGLARFTPDGKSLLFADCPHLRVWDLDAGKERHARPASFDQTPVLAFSADGSRLASAGWSERSVVLWDLTKGEPRLLPLSDRDPGTVLALGFRERGKSLGAVRYVGAVETIDVATGKGRATPLFDPDRKRGEPLVLSHPQLAADGQSVSAFERITEPMGEVTRLGRWELPSGWLTRKHRLAEPPWGALWLGDAVAVSSQLGVDVLDAATATSRYRLAAIPGHGPVAASADGLLLAGAYSTDPPLEKVPDPREVGVWEVASGHRLALLKTGRPYHLAVSTDGRTLAVVTDSVLSVWDVAAGKETARHALPLTGLDEYERSFVTALALSPDGRRAVTSLLDATALVWDVGPPRALAEADLAGDWQALAGEAGPAHAALWRLRDAPEGAVVALLRRHLKPAAAPDAALIRRLVAALDADDFDARQAAEKGLADLGDLARPALRRALEQPTSPEVRTRLETLLSRPPGLVSAPGVLRQVRAMALLERIGSAEARRLLAELAAGEADSEQTREARAALGRLGEKP